MHNHASFVQETRQNQSVTVLLFWLTAQARQFLPSQQQVDNEQSIEVPHGVKPSAAGLQCVRAWMDVTSVQSRNAIVVHFLPSACSDDIECKMGRTAREIAVILALMYSGCCGRAKLNTNC